jgi:hypothetical protein
MGIGISKNNLTRKELIHHCESFILDNYEVEEGIVWVLGVRIDSCGERHIHTISLTMGGLCA